MNQEHSRPLRSSFQSRFLSYTTAFISLFCALPPPLAADVATPEEIPSVVERPIEVFWGAYRRNEHLVDQGAAGWSMVRQHVDGLLLHGAYWNNATNTIGSPSPNIVGPKLATLLNEVGGKQIIMEHGLAGAYPNVETAVGNAYAGNPTDPAGFTSGIGHIKRIMSYGFPQPEISTDYIMRAWRHTARAYPAWTSKEFFTGLVGPWETYDGTVLDPTPGSYDRETFGWFRQWVEGLAAAFPDIRVTCTNSPVYLNWEESGVNRRELGEGFSGYYTWLKLERRGNHVIAMFSGDGFGWEPLGSAEVPLGSSPVAGMFTSSMDGNRLAQARFNNLRVLPFYYADIGKTGGGGSITLSGANYTVKSHGNHAHRPNNSNRDAQFYAWREWSGDGTFTARLNSLVGSNPTRTNPAQHVPCAGISIRETSARDSRQIGLFANLANQLEFHVRTTTGGLLLPVIGSGSPLANLGVDLSPRWLRLTRTGDTISASHSADGTTWTRFGSANLALPETIQIGMFADSEVYWEEATAVFSDVDFLTLPNVSFTGANLGSAGTGATSSVSGSTYTLKSRGSGLAGTADAGRLHSTPLSGDGTLVARLAWFADDANNASPLPAGAQIGLTMRASTDASAPQFGIAFTPNLGLQALHRATTSATTQLVADYGVGEVSVQQLGSNYRPLLHYFTGNDYLGALHDAFPDEYFDNFAGFTTDSPYGTYQKWKGSETNTDAISHRRKIILYERWLHQRGRTHEFIANSGGGSSFPAKTDTQAERDQWDAAFKRDSLRSIQLHQLEGGRPDRVLFESWMDGPFTIVPETQANSFANLALDGLKYIKGTGQNLDLMLRRADETEFAGDHIYQTEPSGAQSREWQATGSNDTTSFTVRLVNRGTVAALPVIHSHEAGGSNWGITYQIGTNHVSSAIRSSTGHVVTAGALYSGNELIAPGATIDLTLNIQASNPIAQRTVLVRAFWNPQDPSGVARDMLELTLTPPPTPPPGWGDVFMTANDPGNTSSFNSAQSWSDGWAPYAGNNYFTGNREMRTPEAAGVDQSLTFSGDSLTLGPGGFFTYKRDVTGPVGTTYASTFTFNNGGLILASGTVRNNSARELTLILAGNLSVTAESTFSFSQTLTSPQTYEIKSSIMGSAPIKMTVAGTTGVRPRFLTLSGDNGGFSGGFKMGEGMSEVNMQDATLKVNHSNALGTGVIAMTYGAVDLNGFSPTIGGLSGGTNSGTFVRNNNATAATLSVGSNNEDSSYAGVIQNGTGTVALNKVGAGTLTLSGVNTYTGATHITGGTLVIHGAQTTTGTLTVANNSRLGGNGSTPAAVNLQSGGKLLVGISDWTGSAGSGFADLQVGSLNIGNSMIVDVTSHTAYQNLSETNKTFPFLTASGGISGFEGANVEIVIHDSFTGSGTWAVARNGNILELVYTAGNEPSHDYARWNAQYPDADLSDPNADYDGDGLSNFYEYAFGLDPTSGALINPILDISKTKTTGIFSYTRRANSGLNYTVWTSPNLQTWTEQVDVTQTLGGTTVDGVQIMVVTLEEIPINDLLFIRVRAD